MTAAAGDGMLKNIGKAAAKHAFIIAALGAATVVGAPAITPMLSDAGATVATAIKNGLAL